MELIFHKSKKYIDEDIFYYISDQRDKHSMIKPKKENLISMTVASDYLKFPSKGEVNNAFYPFEKNSIDKIIFSTILIPIFYIYLNKYSIFLFYAQLSRISLLNLNR